MIYAGRVTAPYAWEYEDFDHPRPAEIAVLETLCNTVDRHTYGAHAAKPVEGRDLLATPAGLQQWFAAADLLSGHAERDAGRPVVEHAATVDADELEQVRSLRDGLRSWLQLRQGSPFDAVALRRCDEVLSGLRLQAALVRPAKQKDARVALVPAGSGVTEVLERVITDLVTAELTGTLARLKICHALDCQFAYYDHSRSRTSRWCSMETCGNRIKTRRYREHRRR